MKAVVVWVLKIALGLIFVAVGGLKLAGSGGTVELFAAIGWGQWFRYFAGAVDVVAALMLFVPRWTWLAALLLACSVGFGATFYVLLHNNPAVPVALTLIAVVLAVLSRPRSGEADRATKASAM